MPGRVCGARVYPSAPGWLGWGRPTLLAATENFLIAVCHRKPLLLLPSQMTDETIGDPSTSSGRLGPASWPHQRARSDVVPTAALTRRQRPSRSCMLFRRIRPEPTVAA